MNKVYYNIDERIALLEAKRIFEKQELMHMYKRSIRKFQPFSVIGLTLWEALKTPSIQKVVIGAALQLVSKVFVKNKP